MAKTPDHDKSKSSNEPLTVGDVAGMLFEAGREGMHVDLAVEGARKAAARKKAAQNLARGSAGHHLEILADPAADSEKKEQSRRGVQGDEADLLAADPDAHADTELDP